MSGARGHRLLPTVDRVLGRPLGVGLACVVVLVLAATFALPEPAAALSPQDLVPSPLDLLPSTPSLDPAQWAVNGFKSILKYIFGDQVGELGRHLINLLLSVPLLADTAAFPRLNAYRDYVTGGAWGILGLSFVVASLRYWLSSYGGSGAYEALMGFMRSAGAIAILLVFPVVFDQLARGVNAFTSALVVNPIVGDGLGKGMVGVLSTTPGSGGGIAMLIGLAAIVVALILLVIKVIVTALLAVLFVASPLAIALWPIEELSWALRSLAQAMLGLLVFPILWAVCFGTFAVLGTDALFPGNHGDLISSALAPLITLATLVIAFRLPFAILRQAMHAGISPGINRGLSTIHHVDRMHAIGVRVGGR
ncbi:MAG: hypothetical protein QOG56_3029 [Solirubrobacteraceae bacterium]|nr:hypothetical protein [Solirubrobacteraceae bacterium]